MGLRGGEDTKTTSSLSAEMSEPRFDSDSEEVGAGEAVVAGGAPVDAFSGSDAAAVSSSVEDSASLLIFSAI